MTVKIGRLLKALGEQEHQLSEFSALVVEYSAEVDHVIKMSFANVGNEQGLGVTRKAVYMYAAQYR